MVQQMIGFTAPVFAGSPYVPAFFGTAVYLYGGSVFVKGGLRELRDRLPGMMTLISLAITVAWSGGPPCIFTNRRHALRVRLHAGKDAS